MMIAIYSEHGLVFCSDLNARASVYGRLYITYSNSFGIVCVVHRLASKAVMIQPAPHHTLGIAW